MTFADNHNLETAVTILMKQNATWSMPTVPVSPNGETRYEGCAISGLARNIIFLDSVGLTTNNRHPDPLVTLEIF